MAGDFTDRMQALLDRQDIHDLAMRYCRACDRIDADLLKTVFHEDAYLAYGTFDGPAPEFVTWVIDHIRNDYVHGYHAIANEYVVVDGDAACGELYAIINNIVVAEDGRFIENTIWGRYLDQYERRDGEWRIAHRQFLLDSIESRPSSDQVRDQVSDAGADLGRGQRSAQDASYALLSPDPATELDR